MLSVKYFLSLNEHQTHLVKLNIPGSYTEIPGIEILRLEEPVSLVLKDFECIHFWIFPSLTNQMHIGLLMMVSSEILICGSIVHGSFLKVRYI